MLSPYWTRRDLPTSTIPWAFGDCSANLPLKSGTKVSYLTAKTVTILLFLCHSTFKTTTKITSLRSSSISAIDIRKHYSSSNLTPYQSWMSYLPMPGGFHKALKMTKHKIHTPSTIEKQQDKNPILSTQLEWKNPHVRGFTKACLRATALSTMPSAPCQLRSTSASDIVYEFNNQCHNSPIKT